MKALILAAGFGIRLMPLTENSPKSLVEVNGTPIIIKQIMNLHENGVHDITVISGYKADILKKRVHAEYPDVRVVESVNYATTNNMYSAFLGREYLSNSNFLMMNADVFFDASVVSSLLSFSAPDAIVVDIGTFYEESMKVVEKDGRLIEISKKVAKNKALGVSIDIYKFSPTGGESFFDKCSEYIDNGKLTLWSEVAINDIMPYVFIQACPLNGRWYEIDTIKDLERASSIFS